MKVKVLILDVDGTLTDGNIYIGNSGEVFKQFFCKDGLALLFLKEIEIIPIIITARESKVVIKRAEELGITEIYQNQKNKNELLIFICEKYNICPEEIAYIGDDINDLKIMKQCGIKMCPADAQPEIKGICNYISLNAGGRGAVRDCLQYLFKKIGCYDSFIQYYA